MKTRRRLNYKKIFKCPCSPDVGDCPNCKTSKSKKTFKRK